MSKANARTQPFPPEISCRVAINLLLYFESRYGRKRLEEVLPRLESPLAIDELLDPRNFISFDFAARLLDILCEESGNPDFSRNSGRFLATPQSLGFAYYMLRALGSPRFAYAKAIEIGPSFNRAGSFTVEHLGAQRLKLRYTSHRTEKNRRLCEARMGQFAAFPTIWGLPEAEAVEHQCQVEGGDSCVYEFRWNPSVNQTLFTLAGALGGLLVSFLLPGHSGLDTAALGLAGGSALGTAFAYRRLSRQQLSLLEEQSDGMALSMSDLQSRFDEIQQLNATLEQKVETRTLELRETTAQLQQALDRQLELDRLKTQFFQNVSHELRTPLTLILAPIESLLAEGDLSLADRRQLEMVQRAAARLLGLINSLLDLSKLDASRLRLSLSDADPAQLVRHIVESATPLARERGIELTYSGPETLNALPLDVDKVEKAVINLISNALKFTGIDPSRPATVDVGVELRNQQLFITVSDTGIGIPESELQPIFERFHQVDGSDQRRVGGTGIGLSLVKEFVEFHCGRVSVNSTPGVGSTFTLTLPTSRDAYPAERLDRRRVSEEVTVDRRSTTEHQKLSRLITNPSELSLADLKGAPEAPPPVIITAGVNNRTRVLVADDNPDMLAYLTTILARDHEVLTATDGEQALRIAQEKVPHIIVSDVMMPNRNGYSLVRELKRLPHTRSIPVILVTAKADVQNRIAGIEYGADDYLTKPFNFLELRARIRQLLRSRALERSLAEKNEYLAKLNFDLVLSKKEVFLETIEALAFALEAKDPYTHGHSRRVSLLSTELGRGMALTELEIERVRISAVLHDIGKLGIPEDILRKEGSLNGPEEEIIRRHPEIGYGILRSVKELADVNRCILLHHEKFDGTGYPQGLVGHDIPLESRIIAVADTYDAMTSDRPYRKGLGHHRAIDELERFSGSQFDPLCVQEFLKLYKDRPPVFPEFPSAFDSLRKANDA